MTRETGFYQAPPRSGAIQGPTRMAGLNFGAITLPEIRLRLPSIELPSRYRAQQGARMRIEAADAQWVSTGFETVRAGGAVATPAVVGERAGAAAEEADDTRSRDARRRSAPEADCEQAKREYEAKLRDLQSKLEDCEKLKRCIEECLKKYPPATTDSDAPTSSLTPPRPPADVGSRPQRLPPTQFLGIGDEGLSQAAYNVPLRGLASTRQPQLSRLPPTD